MNKQVNVNAILNTSSGPIPVKDFSYFFYYFRAVYVAALYLKQQHEISDDPDEYEINKLTDLVLNELAHREAFKISNLALANLGVDEDLTFTYIHRENPTEITLLCIGVPLLIAVIISGGEVSINKNGFRVKLPPLGKGIAELKKAIRQEPDRKAIQKVKARGIEDDN